jgi:hypothetical protein
LSPPYRITGTPDRLGSGVTQTGYPGVKVCMKKSAVSMIGNILYCSSIEGACLSASIFCAEQGGGRSRACRPTRTTTQLCTEKAVEGVLILWKNSISPILTPKPVFSLFQNDEKPRAFRKKVGLHSYRASGRIDRPDGEEACISGRPRDIQPVNGGGPD